MFTILTGIVPPATGLVKESLAVAAMRPPSCIPATTGISWRKDMLGAFNVVAD